MNLRDLISLLQCPTCGDELVYQPVPQRDAEVGACGLLRCGCALYPVLDGIPILTQERLAHRSIGDDRIVADGPKPGDVAALIEAGEGLRALLDLLAFPVCPWPLNKAGLFRQLSLRGPHYAWGLALRKRRLRRMLARRAALTAEDWMTAFYWHAPAPFDPFNYFFFRFGQPRHLAALALLSVLPEHERPVLDLACGYGHMLHALTAQGRKLAVGLDQNFHQVWVANHYVSPGAAFVCADAERPLPFGDRTFSATFCTDAFHCLHDKGGALAEIRRCTGAGPVLLAAVGNGRVEPPDFHELTPEGYAALLEGWQWRVRAEEDLVAGYLDGRKPDLTTSSPEEDIARSKWLYYVAAGDDAIFRNHGRFAAWPHAAGEVHVNPIYKADGDRLVFRFPSRWYRAENEAMLDYMPVSVSLKDESAAELTARCVLIGLPTRYARSTGRPWVFAANRILSFFIHRLRA